MVIKFGPQHIIGTIAFIGVSILLFLGIRGNTDSYNSFLLSQEFKGVVTSIFVDKQDHAQWKIVLTSGNKVPVAEGWLSTIAIGDSVYKVVNDSFLVVIKKNEKNEVKIKYTID